MLGWINQPTKKPTRAKEQEGTCPCIVLTVTSRVTFLEVRGNSVCFGFAYITHSGGRKP